MSTDFPNNFYLAYRIKQLSLTDLTTSCLKEILHFGLRNLQSDSWFDRNHKRWTCQKIQLWLPYHRCIMTIMVDTFDGKMSTEWHQFVKPMTYLFINICTIDSPATHFPLIIRLHAFEKKNERLRSYGNITNEILKMHPTQSTRFNKERAEVFLFPKQNFQFNIEKENFIQKGI